MPAIDLTRLRTRISRLKELYDQPQAFVAGLREIFNTYADPTLPLGIYSSETSLMPDFNTPPLLSRELELAISGYGLTQTAQTLEIIDLLWQEPELELRQLAVNLLKKLPREEIDAVVKRTLDWSSEKGNAPLLPFLHQQVFSFLHRQDPQAWLQILEAWKTANETWKNRMALQGLIPLIEDRNFANLPLVFTFLTSYFEKIDAALQLDLQIVLEKLAKRSEVETIFYLKQMISFYPNPTFGRFLRQSLGLFSTSAQDSLRTAMRDQEGMKHPTPPTGQN